jgi:predicted ATPase
MPVLYDPFGRDFLVRVWKTAPRTRSSRLEKIAKALQVAVPQFKSIGINADELGVPHLEVEYEHWRAISAKQSERDLSDGTLRLIGFMWSLYEGDGPVLLEEPEGSLHKEIVRKLVTLLDTVNRSRRTRRQFIISTHSEDLLMDPTVAAEEVLRFEPAKNGTQIVLANEVDKHRMKAGLTAADVLLPQSSPRNVDQLAFHL